MVKRIVLVCPSNIIHMPYLRNYIEIFKGLQDVEFFVINWDRFSIEAENSNVYKDKKVGHRRNYFEYYKFSRFVIRRLKEINCDKIVVFGLQLVYFLRRYLSEIKFNYIIDVRDYNRIIRFSDCGDSINNSFFTTISSPDFKSWLPKYDNYLVNHNTFVSGTDDLRAFTEYGGEIPVVLSCIGALKDFDVNRDLINATIGDSGIVLKYSGEGVINLKLINYVAKNDISNVEVSGRYQPAEESGLYGGSTIINMLMSGGSINNKTCLSNRLYNSMIYGKPLVAIDGSYLSDVIRKYKIGLSVSSFENFSVNLHRYLNESFNYEYENGRNSFMSLVVLENKFFIDSLKRFVQ